MAEQGYRQVLAIDSRHADSLHLLGMIGYLTGNHDTATMLVGNAIAVRPTEPSYYNTLGTVLQAQGKKTEAVAQYEQAIQLNPLYAEAHMNLGNLLHSLKLPKEAAERYKRALVLKPDYAEAHMNLGNALQDLGRREEAVARYEHALALKSNYAEAHMNLGNALRCLGRPAEALAHCERSLACRPDYCEAHVGLGNALEDLGRFESAINEYRYALQLSSTHVGAHTNMANALHALDRSDEAIAHYLQALTINPDAVEAHVNLGNVLHDIGRVDEACLHYQRALALDPGYVEAHINFGALLETMDRPLEAMEQFEQALALTPAHAEAHVAKGLGLLRRGQFASGWQSYEWRWALKDFVQQKVHLSQPRWNGESLSGRRILLYAEQGLGDCLQFFRYIPLVIAAGGVIILEIPPALMRLGEALPGIEKLVVSGQPLPPFDCYCPLMSLPLPCATNYSTIPSEVPYLTVPHQAEQKASSYKWPAEGLRVGLVWAGNMKHKKDKSRSIPLTTFRSLFHLEGVHLFSLQIGKPLEQLSGATGVIADLAPLISDMADTAAYVAQLDLVISVDTSVAHLAGALAKPIWILLAHHADWRWFTGRDHSPWYPTAKLFRQETPGNWNEVVDRVAEELTSLSKMQPLLRTNAR
jgi:tetratricopeptide (TPR) repeat protein